MPNAQAVLENELDLLEESLIKYRKVKVLETVGASFEQGIAALWREEGRLLGNALSSGLPLRVSEAAGDQAGFERAAALGTTLWPWEITEVQEFYWRLLADKTRLKWLTLADRAGAASMYEGIQKGNLDWRTSFSQRNPKAIAWLTENGGWMVQNVSDETRKRIHDYLVEARDLGMGHLDVAKGLEAMFVEFGDKRPQSHIRTRAHLIAVNEVAKAYEMGNRVVIEGLQEAGYDMEKSWLAVDDNKLDPECERYENQGWIAADRLYEGGMLQPPAHPACRCTTLYRERAKPAGSFRPDLQVVEGRLTRAEKIRRFKDDFPDSTDYELAKRFGVRPNTAVSALRLTEWHKGADGRFEGGAGNPLSTTPPHIKASREGGLSTHVSASELATQRVKVRLAVRNAPVPTPEAVARAKIRYATPGGARLAERNDRGKTSDRLGRRKFLVRHFGDGNGNVACSHCGLRLTVDNVSADRIITGSRGGTYKQDNIIPADVACNKSRGERPMKGLMASW